MTSASIARRLAVLSLTLAATSALAQLVPPDSTFSPPPASPITPVDIDSSPLAPIRGNQTLTTDAYLGSINNEPVFALDVLRPIDANLRRLADTSKDISAFRAGARKLINGTSAEDPGQLSHFETEVILYSAAKSALSEDDRKRIDIYLNMQLQEMITSYGGSVPLTEKGLHAKPTPSSISKEMEDKRRSVTVQYYLSKQFAARINVTRQMIMDTYQRDIAKYQIPTTLDLYTLTLPVVRWFPRQPNDKGEIGTLLPNPTPDQIKAAENQALAVANEIVAKVKKGDDFAALVEDYRSRDTMARVGGRQPNVKKDSLSDQRLADYVFSLPANTVGQPLLIREANAADSRVIVAKVGDRTEGRTQPFSEVQAKIANDLSDAQRVLEWNKLSAKLTDHPAADGDLRNHDIAVQKVMEIAVTLYAAK